MLFFEQSMYICEVSLLNFNLQLEYRAIIIQLGVAIYDRYKYSS